MLKKILSDAYESSNFSFFIELPKKIINSIIDTVRKPLNKGQEILAGIFKFPAKFAAQVVKTSKEFVHSVLETVQHVFTNVKSKFLTAIARIFGMGSNSVKPTDNNKTDEFQLDVLKSDAVSKPSQDFLNVVHELAIKEKDAPEPVTQVEKPDQVANENLPIAAESAPMPTANLDLENKNQEPKAQQEMDSDDDENEVFHECEDPLNDSDASQTSDEESDDESVHFYSCNSSFDDLQELAAQATKNEIPITKDNVEALKQNHGLFAEKITSKNPTVPHPQPEHEPKAIKVMGG